MIFLSKIKVFTIKKQTGAKKWILVWLINIYDEHKRVFGSRIEQKNTKLFWAKRAIEKYNKFIISTLRAKEQKKSA